MTVQRRQQRRVETSKEWSDEGESARARVFCIAVPKYSAEPLVDERARLGGRRGVEGRLAKAEADWEVQRGQTPVGTSNRRHRYRLALALAALQVTQRKS
jgi:hypothetical protein